MDIHRSRFVPYPPSSINAVAFSHQSDVKQIAPTDLRLALGRGNGDVEIWNPQNGDWVQETVLKGNVDSTIEQLTWTQDYTIDENDDTKLVDGPLRLFSTGGTKTITEWDLNLGNPKRQADANFADIWCFAAQPRFHGPTGTVQPDSTVISQYLAAGCADGTVVLFSTADNDLQYLRPVAAPSSRKPKVISLTWRDRRTIVAGYEDSTIRLIDVQNRSILRSMTLGKSPDRNNSVVWTVKCLPDGTILSGDSSGELKIWDAKTLSLVQRLKTHQADILDISTSAKGDMIFTIGVDRRTVAYQPVAARQGNSNQRWTQVMHRRFHEHDSKCSASFESKDISVLVSGGTDACPIVVPLRHWQTQYHRTLSHLPQVPPVSSSTQSRLFVSWWEHEMAIYHVPPRANNGNVLLDSDQSQNCNYELLTTLRINGENHLQTAQLSRDGTLLMASTSTDVKLFQLRKAISQGNNCLRTRQINLPLSFRRFGARCVGFSPDTHWLYAVRPDNTLTLLKILASPSPKEPPTFHEKVIKLGRKSRGNFGPDSTTHLGKYRRTINCVAFSSDSRVVATGDLSGAINVWLLEGHEDTEVTAKEKDHESDPSSDDSDSDSDDEDDSFVIHGQKWIRNPAGPHLPQLESAILSLTFRPQTSSPPPSPVTGNVGLHATRHNPHPVSHELPVSDVRLVAITAKHQLIEFDVLSCTLSEWSRRNPPSRLPTDFARIKDRVMGAFWDSSKVEKGERLWMYGPTWMFMLDLSQDLQSFGTEKVGRLGQYHVMVPLENGQTKRNTMGTPNDKPSMKRKRQSGAGDQVKSSEVYIGLASPSKKSNISNDHTSKMIDIDQEMGEDEDENHQGSTDLMDRLAHIRRDKDPNLETANHTNGHKVLSNDSDHEPDGDLPSPTTINQWHTFQYRSILGIAIISDNSSDAGQEPTGASSKIQPQPNNLEVVIIERPTHDVEQPPRFEGGQDWES